MNLLTKPITELSGAFTADTIPPNIPLTILTIPSHALLQLPLNTPCTKSIIPLRIGFKELFHKSLIPLKT